MSIFRNNHRRDKPLFSNMPDSLRESLDSPVNFLDALRDYSGFENYEGMEYDRNRLNGSGLPLEKKYDILYKLLLTHLKKAEGPKTRKGKKGYRERCELLSAMYFKTSDEYRYEMARAIQEARNKAKAAQSKQTEEISDKVEKEETEPVH